VCCRKIAEHLATSTPKEKVVLVDAFAGAGGNTIAFAKSGRWKRVYAIEKNPAVLACAKHNAKIYGVETGITWFEGDCFEIMKNQLKDLGPFSVVFASPPWGGNYNSPENTCGMVLTDTHQQDPDTGPMRFSIFKRWNLTR